MRSKTTYREIPMKKEINVFDYAGEILSKLQGGVLLTTKTAKGVNSMTIGWGMIGIEWSRPIFTAFVREGRYTKEQLDISDEFTISVPYGKVDKRILGVCGTKSGRDCDKITELGLSLEQPRVTSVPGIAELPLTLECRVIYKQRQDPAAIGPEITKASYPQDVDSSFHGSNRDYHIAYYGEIVSAYIIE